MTFTIVGFLLLFSLNNLKITIGGFKELITFFNHTCLICKRLIKNKK